MRLPRLLATAGLLACAAVLPARADATKTGFVDKTFKNADGTTSPYVVFVPKDYDGKKEYPIILFLHGAGETKQPNAKKEGKMPVEVGIGPAIKKREKDFPFIVVIPRAEGFGWGADTANAKRALAMLDETMKEYKTDAKRQYLTGLSMGGFGTWSIATAHPDRWAAIVPVCGGGNVKDAEKIKNIPTWVFHGDADTAVKVDRSREMVDALKKAGGKPKYDEYPGVGHNSWDKAYGTDELYKWLLDQKKK
ncbi:MAG: prolyl oligopeptidase family serine peptidase [Planctomycetes bacterium]|nr:prolyl oligopeptidase family serine peptidase [Planctomycetota bacterium]